MTPQELDDLRYNLLTVSSNIKNDLGNSATYDPYVMACLLVLEKADDMEQHANEVPGMGPLFKAIGDEFRSLIVNAVLFGQDHLAGHKPDVTP